MKSVIKRKIYDTETAELLAKWNNGYPDNDFQFEFGELYKTLRGNLFLFVGGGALSQYRRPGPGRSLLGAQEIRPVSMAEAIAWLEEKEQSDAAIKIGGDSIENA